MPRWIGFFLLFEVALTALMPPGLCSCWIHPERETVHVHFGHAHAEAEHSHEYLAQWGLTDTGGVIPLLMIPAALFVFLSSQSHIFFRITRHIPSEKEWKPDIVPPPPQQFDRATFSSC